MYAIDVHIITHGEPQWMLDRCLKSLEGQPVNIHLVEGFTEFPPEKGRALGLSKGSAPYISWVDPDDWCEPDMYKRLLDLIETTGAEIVYCWEYVYLDDKVVVNTKPHHGIVAKREISDLFVKSNRCVFDRRDTTEVIATPLYHHDRRQETRNV